MSWTLRLSLLVPVAMGLAVACHTEPAPCVPRAKAKQGAEAKGHPVGKPAPAKLTRASAGERKTGDAKPKSDAGPASAAKSGEPKPPVKEADDGPHACPAGMLLVEGDYCSKVKHECLSSWHDDSNDKTVCEKFEPKATCVGTKTKKRYCIDRYEWPNKKGERPEVMNRFHQAEVKCAALGKRLCTESEWTMACEGPALQPFPYGFERDTEICHGDVMWDSPVMSKVAARDATELARLWKGVRSGSQPGCVSGYGVYDLPGNADEVVASETFSSDFRGKFDSVHTGGPWYKGVRNQCRPKIYTHDEGFYYYFLSFRCCAEPDGEKTDPLTPKQKKDKWGFEKVERLAGFTREDVKDALAKKAKQGNCGCGEKNTRCNTICGTLLGPNAKDYPKQSKPKPMSEKGKSEKGKSDKGSN